jgi:hypothetical protein
VTQTTNAPEQGGIHHWIPSPTSPTETNAPAGQGLREDPNGRIHDLKVCPNVGHVTATGQHHHDIDSHGTPRSHVPASGRRPTAVRPANPAHRCAPPSCGSRCPAAWRRAAWHEQRSAITDLDFLPADRAVTGVAMGWAGSSAWWSRPCPSLLLLRGSLAGHRSQSRCPSSTPTRMCSRRRSQHSGRHPPRHVLKPLRVGS